MELCREGWRTTLLEIKPARRSGHYMQDNTTFEEYNGPNIADFEDAQNYIEGKRLEKYQSQLSNALNQILDSDGLNDLEQELDDKEADERLDGMWERSL